MFLINKSCLRNKKINLKLINFLFDNKDKLVYRGAIDDNARDAKSVDEPYLANAIDQLIAGNPIEKPISKAIGCGIKFP